MCISSSTCSIIPSNFLTINLPHLCRFKGKFSHCLIKKKFRMQWRTQGGGRSTVAPSSTFKSFRRSHVDCSAMTVDYAIPGTPIVLSDGSISLCTLFHLESTEHTILQQTTFIGNSLSTPRLEKILPTYILITVCQI